MWNNLLEEPALLGDLVWTRRHEHDAAGGAKRHAIPGIQVTNLMKETRTNFIVKILNIYTVLSCTHL